MKGPQQLARISQWSGIVLLLAGLWLGISKGLSPPSLSAMWIGWILALVPRSVYRLFIEKNVVYERNKRILVGSWVFLMMGAILSAVYVVIFPNWELWIVPMKTISNPLTVMMVFALPAIGVLYYCMLMDAVKKFSEIRAKRDELPSAE